MTAWRIKTCRSVSDAARKTTREHLVREATKDLLCVSARETCEQKDERLVCVFDLLCSRLPRLDDLMLCVCDTG